RNGSTCSRSAGWPAAGPRGPGPRWAPAECASAACSTSTGAPLTPANGDAWAAPGGLVAVLLSVDPLRFRRSLLRRPARHRPHRSRFRSPRSGRGTYIWRLGSRSGRFRLVTQTLAELYVRQGLI